MASERRPALVVLGAGGQLGRALVAAGPPSGWRLAAFDRDAADITEAQAVARALDGCSGGGVVVNAAAYTAVDRAEAEPDMAFAINATGAGIVAAAAAARGLALVQVSTDYVFAGDQARPYTEVDAPAPVSVYGASKWAGEQAVLAAHDRVLVLRTAWLFGPHGPCFPRTMVRLARTRPDLAVVADQIGCPTAAPDLAAIIRHLAPNLALAVAGDPLFGLLHCAGSEPVSWCDFAAAVLDGLSAMGLTVPPLKPIATADYPLPARRPPYSVLESCKLGPVLGLTAPAWRPALAACLPVFVGES